MKADADPAEVRRFLDAAADGSWPRYSAERWKKLKRSLGILADDLRSDRGGWS